ncbi:MAG: VWA domain-containing protein [Myxococcales bacterium]|nr:VWA domain-containing protein [Myxococcales bacterium]MCB9704004.1 VWA domain-containing protein [Myxococcales bacterium]
MRYEVIVLDRSGSQWERWRSSVALTRALIGGLGYDRNLMIGMVGFNDEVLTESTYTRDRERLNGAIDAMIPMGLTSLWDALMVALAYEKPRPSAIYIVSDFRENASDLAPERVLELARDLEVELHAIIPPALPWRPGAGPEAIDAFIPPLRHLPIPIDEPGDVPVEEGEAIAARVAGTRIFRPTLTLESVERELMRVVLRQL